VLRHGGLRQVESLDDLAAYAALAPSKKAQDLDSRRVTERLGQRRQLGVGLGTLDGTTIVFAPGTGAAASRRGEGWAYAQACLSSFFYDNTFRAGKHDQVPIGIR
jgi:hypothetical protein